MLYFWTKIFQQEHFLRAHNLGGGEMTPAAPFSPLATATAVDYSVLCDWFNSQNCFVQLRVLLLDYR